MTGGRHAWIDASAGVAGDMLLGALLDAGADRDVVQAAVDAVAPGAVRVVASTVTRAGLRAAKADVEVLVADPPRRTWRDIRGMIAAADLPEQVRDNATAVFATLAEVEAAVHGVSPDDVHFHEVGALDAIADVVGVCAALHALGIGTVSAGEVALGSGTVRTAHGELPVPAPAVARLAIGWRVRAGGDGELATPTGMAVLRTLTGTCEDLPPMRVDVIGVGAGGRDLPGRANVVRVVLGHRVPAPPGAGTQPSDPAADPASREGPQPTGPAAGPEAPDRPAAGIEAAGIEAMVLLEANVDDLDPRLWPGVLDSLLRAGAADAWLVPILMKKGRPAHTLSVLCHPERAGALRAEMFRHTTTLGVREHALRREAVPRAFVDVTVDGRPVAVKVGHRDGMIVQVMPEFEQVAALARELGRPEREVLREVTAAAAHAGLTVGAPLPTTARPA